MGHRHLGRLSVTTLPVSYRVMVPAALKGHLMLAGDDFSDRCRIGVKPPAGAGGLSAPWLENEERLFPTRDLAQPELSLVPRALRPHRL